MIAAIVVCTKSQSVASFGVYSESARSVYGMSVDSPMDSRHPMTVRHDPIDLCIIA